MPDQYEELEARVSALETLTQRLEAEIDRLRGADQVEQPAEAPRVVPRTPTRLGYPTS